MLSSLSNNKSATVLLGAASVASLYVLSNSKEKRTRRAKVVCHCGKVEAELYIPAANYRYLEPACFQCGCNDCVDFVDKVRDKLYLSMIVDDVWVEKTETDKLQHASHTRHSA
jgi:polyferredoxin